MTSQLETRRSNKIFKSSLIDRPELFGQCKIVVHAANAKDLHTVLTIFEFEFTGWECMAVGWELRHSICTIYACSEIRYILNFILEYLFCNDWCPVCNSSLYLLGD